METNVATEKLLNVIINVNDCIIKEEKATAFWNFTTALGSSLARLTLAHVTCKVSRHVRSQTLSSPNTLTEVSTQTPCNVFTRNAISSLDISSLVAVTLGELTTAIRPS